MSQRTATIATLSRRLATADVAAEHIAHVQARITSLKAMTDDQYLAEMRPRGGAQL